MVCHSQQNASTMSKCWGTAMPPLSTRFRLSPGATCRRRRIMCASGAVSEKFRQPALNTDRAPATRRTLQPPAPRSESPMTRQGALLIHGWSRASMTWTEALRAGRIPARWSTGGQTPGHSSRPPQRRFMQRTTRRQRLLAQDPLPPQPDDDRLPRSNRLPEWPTTDLPTPIHMIRSLLDTLIPETV